MPHPFFAARKLNAAAIDTAAMKINRSLSGSQWVRATEIAGLLGLIFLALGWLAPNKAFPWLTVWNESATICGLLLLFVAAAADNHRHPDNWRLSWPIAAFVTSAVTSVWIQKATGLLDFSGDAWMVTLYILAFGLAAIVGSRLANSLEQTSWMKSLLFTLLAGGILTAGIVAMQWLLATPPVVFAQELTKGSRPYGNLGQQNHANTLLFLALCAVLQLRYKGWLGTVTALPCMALLTLGMSITQSRTGLLQGAVLLIWAIWASLRVSGIREWRWGVIAVGFLLAWRFAMPWIDDVLLLGQPAREIGAATTSVDLRWPVWRAFFDAALLQPWSGYGWLQSGHAHEAIAACHPGLRYYFHYTHFMPLDLVVWTGFPLGLFLSSLIAVWFFRHWWAPPSNESGYWLVALSGLIVHALLEYPLAYTYFLIPMGLMIGIVDARATVFRAWTIRARYVIAVWFCLASVSAALAYDALRVIDVDTQLRFEDLRIGTGRIVTRPPELLLLDQLGAMYALRATEINGAVSDADLHKMAQGVERLPFSSSMLRLALILGYQGRHQESAHWQQLICDMYSPLFCQRSAERWAHWQREYPGRLQDFVGQNLPRRCEHKKVHRTPT